MNSTDRAVDVSALKEQLQQKLVDFEIAQREGRSQAELNAIYQVIKDIKHQIIFAQPDIQQIMNSAVA